MSEAGRILTVEAFRDVLRSGVGVLITDRARGVTFHPDPASCSHVREEFFMQKVIENRERNGSYFAVASLAEAKKRWPDVRWCGLEASAAAG